MKTYCVAILLFTSVMAYTQSANDILILLVENNIISQHQADSLKNVAVSKQKEAEAARKSFPVSAARQIHLSGYTQIRYQALDEQAKNDGFDLRRARVDIKGNVNSFFSYRLQTDLTDNPRILDAYAEIKINDYLNITLGQFTVPFSLESLSSMSKYEVIDFSLVVDALTGRGKDVIGNQIGRDIGVQLGGSLLKSGDISLLEYRVGLFNGTGINISDTANEAKDVVARLIANPVKGLSVGISYYNGWGKAIEPAADFMGRSQTRNRMGAEASFTSKRWSFKGEYILGKDGTTDRSGWYAMAGYYAIPQKLELVGKYDTYDPDLDTVDNISTRIAAGLNYNFNNWSRIQAFYTFRNEEGESSNNNYLSVQVQIGY
jgi:phosphate-selective porin